VPKLVWRVNLVAELQPGVTTETELARIEREEEAGLADLGLSLDEVKRLTTALQARIVPAQVAIAGERRRYCAACGRWLTSKGHYGATFRSLFGARCRSGSGGCWSAPAGARASRRALPPWISARRMRSHRSWPT
jgi:hypothetical protein